MFEVEKPRRFHYEPRFYDPEKEKWEALKKKYAIEQERQAEVSAQADTSDADPDADSVAYFQQRVRQLDRQRAAHGQRMTWRDMFRKREMPRFEYTPRFRDGVDIQSAETETDGDNLVHKYQPSKHKIKIHRRFDISDSEYMKPIPGTKIILYTAIVVLLLAVVLI